MNQVKAIIFDMDGLMIDSEPYWAQADEAFLTGHMIPYSPEINLHIMGMGQREIIEYYKQTFGLHGDTKELIDERKKLLYSFLIPKVKLLEGVENTIKTIQAKALKLAIATTGHSQSKAKDILEKVGLESYFPIIVSGDEVTNGKPAPDIYLRTAQLLKMPPINCLVLEDAPNGVKAAKAAGMTVYGINRDEKIFEQLIGAGADKVFSKISEMTV